MREFLIVPLRKRSKMESKLSGKKIQGLRPVEALEMEMRFWNGMELIRRM